MSPAPNEQLVNQVPDLGIFLLAASPKRIRVIIDLQQQGFSNYRVR